MFILKDEKTIEKALAKARTVKPCVRIIGFGLYEVAGSKNNAYQVRCKRDERGNHIVACNCKCGAETTRACYHAAAAIGAHIVLAEQRQAARA